MTADVVMCIKKVLLETGEVSLDGFGTFALERSPAYFQKPEQLIHPPAYKLTFTDEIKDPAYFESYFASYNSVLVETARARIEAFTENILQKLTHKNKRIVLQGIGTFSLNENGGVQFTEDLELEEWYVAGLLPVRPVPVKKFTSGTVTPPAVKKQMSFLAQWGPFLVLLAVGLLLIWHYSSKQNLVPPAENPEIEMTESVSPDTVNESGDKVIDALPIDTSGQNTGDVTVQECIIITGFFEKAANVVRMVNKLDALKYSVYLEEMANGTRVGFKFDCTDMDIEEFLRDIRKELSPDAWYLQPPVAVY